MAGVVKARWPIVPLLLFSSTSVAAVRFKSSEALGSPVLACEPAEIRLVLAEDNAASFVFTMKNDGGKTLNWKVESCPTWLTLDTTQGSLGQKESQKITLTVDAGKLRPGLATKGVVSIGSDAGTGPLEIAVSVDVLVAPPVRAVERPGVRDVAEPTPDGDRYEEPLPILPPSGGLVLDDIELMVGRGTQPGAFVGVGTKIRDVEFGILWTAIGDEEEDWGEAYLGYRWTWDTSGGDEWYVGVGLTLDFAVSESNGSSDTFGAWYLHGGWQRKIGKARWGVDLRMSPAVMDWEEPLGIAVTYGW
jgi:hypothetical protein